MEKDVYVCGIKQENLGKFVKVFVELFDKSGKKSEFYTSLMSKYNAEKYISNILKLTGESSWFKVFFGLNPLQFEAVMDSEQNEIVALANEKATLYKNEVVLTARANTIPQEDIAMNR